MDCCVATESALCSLLEHQAFSIILKSSQQENGTSVSKEDSTSKRSPSNGVALPGEALTLVNGVS